MLLLAVAQTAHKASSDWWSDHATLIVGVVGIVFSGFVGPTVTGWWSARREREKDQRALVLARRDDLRALVDEAARVLGGAVAQLRPLLQAELEGRTPPKEPADFLGSLFPLGQRLRLRRAEGDAVVTTFDNARLQLLNVAGATRSQDAFDAATVTFEAARADFLEAGRKAIQAPVSHKQET